MPLLVALDEYESALRAVSIHARLGLAAGTSDHVKAALRAIQAICEEASSTVENVLSHPDAVSQMCVIEITADLMGNVNG